MECPEIIEIFFKRHDILESKNEFSSKSKTQEERDEECSTPTKTENIEKVKGPKLTDEVNKRKRKLANQECQEEQNDKRKLIKLENGSAEIVHQRQSSDVDPESDESEDLKEELQMCQCDHVCDCLYKCYNRKKWYTYYEKSKPDFLAEFDTVLKDKE